MKLGIYIHNSVEKVTVALFPNSYSIVTNNSTGIEFECLNNATSKRTFSKKDTKHFYYNSGSGVLFWSKKEDSSEKVSDAIVLSERTYPVYKFRYSDRPYYNTTTSWDSFNSIAEHINCYNNHTSKVKLCKNCGHITPGSDICPHCETFHHIRRCMSCSRHFVSNPREASLRVHDSSNDDEHSGNITLSGTVSSNGCRYCDECAANLRECNDCGSLFTSLTSTSNSEGETISVCDRCHRARTRCGNCGSSEGPMIQFPDGRRMWLCETCYDDQFNRRIMNYSYKPTPVFRGNGNIFFGVEIEMNMNESLSGDRLVRFFRKVMRENLNKDFNSMSYFKNDASIGHGIEFITHPFSPSFFRKNIDNFELMLKTLQAAGGFAGAEYGADQCGIHVHMSKNSFTPLQIVKLFKFVYENEDFIYKLSGRRSKEWFDRYCGGWDSRSEGKVKDIINYASIAKEKVTNYDRHTAMHMTEHTIELRIFDSTLKIGKFTRIIETCEALYEWSKDVSRRDVNVKSFTDFVFKNKGKFQKLERYLRCV